jgi:guanine deaminase
MPRTVIRRCRALVGTDARLTPEPVDVVIDGERIAAVVDGGTAQAAAIEIDGARLLAAPGLINGHYHSWDHYQKGCLENLPLELFMAYVRPPRPVPLSARQVYVRTILGAIEALRSGTTLIVDDLSLGASFSREHVEAAFAAYEDSGIRALVGFSMIDKPVVDSFPFVADCFPPALAAELRALPRPDGQQLLDLCEELARTRHPRRSRVGVIVAPSAPQRCTDSFLTACRDLADRHDLPVMIHVQETRLQVVTGAELYGKTMVEHLADIGFLGRDTSIVHGVWLNPREIDLLARHGTTVQHNPWSNLMIGSGIAPVRALVDAGVNVSLGTDGMSSTCTCNMLNSLGAAAALGKVRSPQRSRWLTAAEVWRFATAGGARALGRDAELGAIEPGRIADLVCYRQDAVTLTPLNDPVAQLVYAERGAAIDTVLVAGEPVMRGGRLTRIDEQALLAEAQAIHAALQPAIAAARDSSLPFMRAVEASYRRGLETPVAADTHPAWLDSR